MSRSSASFGIREVAEHVRDAIDVRILIEQAKQPTPAVPPTRYVPGTHARAMNSGYAS